MDVRAEGPDSDDSPHIIITGPRYRMQADSATWISVAMQWEAENGAEKREGRVSWGIKGGIKSLGR